MSCWRDERGFTLAELLTALAMLGLVLAGVVAIQQSVLQAYLTGSNKTEVQQNARVALEGMAREIRGTTVALTTATANLITFTHPTDGAITYTIDGTKNLTRNGAPIIGGVQNLILSPALPLFVYRDANDAAGASAANTRRVEVTIQTSSEDIVVAGGIADTRAELATSVRLRNL